MEKQDFINVLRGHPRTPDAIFWYCHAWHSGDDDLYKIMSNLEFTPRPWSDNPMKRDELTGQFVVNPNYDPDLVSLLNLLTDTLKPIEAPLQRVRLRDVREGHVLTPSVPCITPKWPSRVYRQGGALGVECSGGLYCIKIEGSKKPFHPLTEDKYGFVVGFQR